MKSKLNMHFFYNDLRIYYEMAGEGEPLVFLPGNGEDCGYLTAQLEYFSKTNKVILVDTRGQGKSERGNAPLTFDTFCSDLFEFLLHLGFKKYNIVGFSDGANILIHLMIKHPEIINSAVLIGANIFPKGLKSVVRMQIRLEKLTAKLKKDKAMLERLDLMLRYPKLSLNDLKDIKTKTLVLAGDRDMIKQRHTERIAAAIKNSKLKIINGDHFILYNQSERVNAVIFDFLKGD